MILRKSPKVIWIRLDRSQQLLGLRLGVDSDLANLNLLTKLKL